MRHSGAVAAEPCFGGANLRHGAAMHRQRAAGTPRCFEPWMWLPLLAGAVALAALVALVLALYAALSLHTLHYDLDAVRQQLAEHTAALR